MNDQAAGAPPVDPTAAISGMQGAPEGAQAAHHGAVRGQLVGPAEGMQRAEAGGMAPGGSTIGDFLRSLMEAISAKSGVASPNPAPAPPAMPLPGPGP